MNSARYVPYYPNSYLKKHRQNTGFLLVKKKISETELFLAVRNQAEFLANRLSDASCLTVCFVSPQPPTPQLPLKHVDTPVSSCPPPPTSPHCGHMLSTPLIQSKVLFPIHHQHAPAQFSMKRRLVGRGCAKDEEDDDEVHGHQRVSTSCLFPEQCKRWQQYSGGPMRAEFQLLR